MTDWLREAEAIEDRLLEIRHLLHSHPELGNREEWTSSFVASILEDLGIEVERVLETAVIGTLRGKGGERAIGLRADMDALPLEEETGALFSSVNRGVMHACGHDVHMSSVLGAAILLSIHRDDIAGTVKFIFQPDEEGRGGARRIIGSGRLGKLDAVYGGHVCPDLPAGTIGIRYGKFYAASDVFSVTLKGKSSHGATPEKGRNALLAASEAIYRLSLLKREDDDPYVLTVGKMESGHAENIIADKAVFSGILRTLGKENRLMVKERMRSSIRETAEKYGVEAEVNFRESYGGIVNTDDETDTAKEAALALFGKDNVVILGEPTMTTEDFGYFADEFSGSFIHIGVGGEEPLHSPRFIPSDESVVAGSALFAALVWKALGL